MGRRLANGSASVSLLIHYQDAHLVVVEKPHGLPTQGTRRSDDNHLYQHVLERFPRAALHHRLDTPASGLVLFTIDPAANRGIAAAFRSHTIDRRYIAVLAGDPGGEGTWSTPLDGRAARSHYRRLGEANGMSVVEVHLETGRTHQIRRHAALAGHPIIGDRRHGGVAGRLWPRLALHAAGLSLRHPLSGADLKVSSELPEDLLELVQPLAPALARQWTPARAVD